VTLLLSYSSVQVLLSIKIPALVQQFNLIPVFLQECALNLILKPSRHKNPPVVKSVYIAYAGAGCQVNLPLL
jgi:hypothetical protein